MFDRVDHPALGRHGGLCGGATVIKRSDGQPMQGKGKQFVPHGVTVEMAFPGGGGYGQPSERSLSAVHYDIVQGYISAAHATEHYNVSEADVQQLLQQSKLGEN